MNLKEFATKCGVTIGRCDKEWGGTYSYKEDDYVNSTHCGCRTEKKAYEAWLDNNFGERAKKAILTLIKQSEKEKKFPRLDNGYR